MDSAILVAGDERVHLLSEAEGINYGTNRQQRPVPEADEENPGLEEPAERENEREVMVERLTGRLRCLFSAITWPIVPLGTLVTLCLVWVMYSAFVMDVKSSCSHPLHVYALASMCFLLYAPHHSQIRSFLFRYSRERDGPIRPTRVRLYDQLFHTLCILYVYGGVTLMQGCKQDFGVKHDDFDNPTAASHNQTSTDGFANTCDATCPHLYSALDVYITMLELFTLSLILPLLFLPCIYLWILRRASSEADNFWHESLEDSDDLFGRRPPRLTAQELMESLEPVTLVRQGDRLVLLGRRLSSSTTTAASLCLFESPDVVKECCICMSDFKVQEQESDDAAASAPPLDADADAIVRTKCGHVFHATCLRGWVGGRWEPLDRRRRSRQTCCPLCREDLQPSAAGRHTAVRPTAQSSVDPEAASQPDRV